MFSYVAINDIELHWFYRICIMEFCWFDIDDLNVLILDLHTYVIMWVYFGVDEFKFIICYQCIVV